MLIKKLKLLSSLTHLDTNYCYFFFFLILQFLKGLPCSENVTNRIIYGILGVWFTGFWGATIFVILGLQLSNFHG